jgi:hypothetical protein
LAYLEIVPSLEGLYCEAGLSRSVWVKEKGEIIIVFRSVVLEVLQDSTLETLLPFLFLIT